MLCDGDVRMGADFDGKNMDFAVVDGKIYLINNDAKTYMIVNSALAKTMGLDISELQQSASFSWTFQDPSTATRFDEMLDGKPVVSFNVGCGTGTMKVSVRDGKVVRFVKYDNEGKFTADYDVTSFAGGISSSDLLPSDAYKKQNMFSFMADMM